MIFKNFSKIYWLSNVLIGIFNSHVRENVFVWKPFRVSVVFQDKIRLSAVSFVRNWFIFSVWLVFSYKSLIFKYFSWEILIIKCFNKKRQFLLVFSWEPSIAICFSMRKFDSEMIFMRNFDLKCFNVKLGFSNVFHQKLQLTLVVSWKFLIAIFRRTSLIDNYFSSKGFFHWELKETFQELSKLIISLR